MIKNKLVITLLVALMILGLNPRKVEAKANTNATNLMIVAHPDDESIFGGYHLSKKKYLVVCITAGKNKKRVKEFKKAMKYYKDDYMMLGFPDKTNGKRNNWHKCKSKITFKLSKIINEKNWKCIVTHNPDGEYGHIHHKMTSKIVTNLITNKNKLFYFNKYFKRNDLLQNKRKPILNYQKTKKKVKQLYKCYPSQSKVIDHLYHIIDLEKFIPYKQWK
ncbi:MAG: PIG-L family deacetylase [Thomasclavelia sp.]|nr:PIG-L family deacetylase [Thomasclavelia sp.]